MYSNVCQHDHNAHLHGLLYQLWSFQCEGITSEWKVTYIVRRDNFIKELSCDVNTAISFFETLNLNNEADAFAMRFVNQITNSFKTQGEKKKFKQFISTLSEKYSDSPYVDWGVFNFYSAMYAMEDVLTDDEDVYD